MFYEIEAKIHCDESSIFICMHKKLDPAITQVVHDSKFPGLKHKTIDLVQGTLKINFITGFQNCMIKYGTLGQTIQLIQSTFKIFASYVDLFKDTFLASTLHLCLPHPVHLHHRNGVVGNHHHATCVQHTLPHPKQPVSPTPCGCFKSFHGDSLFDVLGYQSHYSASSL